MAYGILEPAEKPKSLKYTLVKYFYPKSCTGVIRTITEIMNYECIALLLKWQLFNYNKLLVPNNARIFLDIYLS